jgi:hypothetical protein
VDATDAAFFDDSLINVGAARESGLGAFHVNGGGSPAGAVCGRMAVSEVRIR